MRLTDLSEGVKYEPGWERTVPQPTQHYLRKSADPLQYWTIDDLVPWITKVANYTAKNIIKKFGLPEHEFDDFVQHGLLQAIRKIKQIQESGKQIHGISLEATVRNRMWDWMRQNDPRTRQSRTRQPSPLPSTPGRT